MKGKYLITTDNWFYTPDGKQYKCVWGEVEIVSDEILGIKTNARSSNWFAKVGEISPLIIAGCQIHYAIPCPIAPNVSEVDDFEVKDGVVIHFKRPSLIYLSL
jgi:hypothetical protein